MADEPLTAEELDALEADYAGSRKRVVAAYPRLIAQARRCLDAEADLAHMYTMEACEKCGATIIAGCWGCRLKAAEAREAALADELQAAVDAADSGVPVAGDEERVVMDIAWMLDAQAALASPSRGAEGYRLAEAFCSARERTEELLLARDALIIEAHYEATRDTALAQRALEGAIYAEGDAWREWKEASRE